MNGSEYIVQGLSLLVVSSVALNLVLQNESRDILDSKVRLSYIMSIFVFASLLFTWISGFLYYMLWTNTTRFLMDLSAFIFWAVMVSANLYIIKVLVMESGVLPRMQKEFFDVVLYFIVLWLLTSHLGFISYGLLTTLSTTASIIGVYFVLVLGKYYNHKDLFIVPLEIHIFYLMSVLASISMGLLLLGRVYNYRSYLFFAILIYVFLIYGVGKIAIELRKYLSKIS
ncbi:hypothetical protein [Geoglobus acetivorans]|uniref:Uncharacterized protein n=1 Tax=Geoglobus acetivorans TaxID=565033 RepID=A0ABZ3H4Y6_GEOAI|nr:hypothetical protein [Geoglobus acetivorans]